MQNPKDNRPAPPQDLDAEALAEWGRVCDELAALGTLELVDRSLLTVYVETWSLNRAAMAHVRQHGAVVKWPNGLPGPNPFYKISRETAGQIKQQLAELGATPATRKAAGDGDDEGLNL